VFVPTCVADQCTLACAQFETNCCTPTDVCGCRLVSAPCR
jgi:hypothetical protein